MKKKIAILTQPLGRNYGGILQNYALQKVLQQNNFIPITINRWNNYTATKWRLFIYYFKIEKIIFRSNFRFLKQYIHLTKKLDSDSEFNKHFQEHDYDGIIVGSDQTWRPKYSPNIYNYYLDFLQGENKSRCVAYASSFGTDHWEYTQEQTRKVKELVTRFDAVSVREDSGKDLCKAYFNIDAAHVLDPTLLLDKNLYRDLYKSKSYVSKKGIFVYVLDQKEENNRIISKTQLILEKDVFRNQPKSSYQKERKSLKDQLYPPVETWVKSFDDADFIITDSFHGTVFSIIFNKPFITIINRSRGESRFYSLLKPLGLAHRIVEKSQDLTPQLLDEYIDYNAVNKHIEIEKQKSLFFLLKALNT